MIEVDLEDDLLMFVTNGKLDYVLNTSTGGGYTYTDDGVTAVANTPVGQLQVYRQVDGMVIDSLGQLWRPKFFDDGFAIHGDSYVPPYPVSHGCVRVSDEAIDWIWSDNLATDRDGGLGLLRTVGIRAPTMAKHLGTVGSRDEEQCSTR